MSDLVPVGQFPAATRAAIRRLLEAPSFAGIIAAGDALALAQQAGQTFDLVMLNLLPCASQYADAPISGFRVGAIALGSSGALYFGANLEFVGQALSCSVHAEQAATAHAWMSGERGLTALAVSAAPCGHCRQFLDELASAATLRVIRPDQEPVMLGSLLPDAFGPLDLGVCGGLMQPRHNQLVLRDPPPAPDPVVSAALLAANLSYAPYSRGYAGVALQTADGGVYPGAYAENAAFNPSLSPLQVALVQLRLAGKSYADIRRVVLVQSVASACSQVDVTRSVLHAVSSADLTIFEALPADQSSEGRGEE